MAFAFLVIVLLIGIDIQQKGVDALTRKTEGGLTMAEYIERETALEIISDMGVSSLSRVAVCDVLKKVEKISAADVAPVVHGRWVPFESEAAGAVWYCSSCDIGFIAQMNYCPNCGAKMDGEKK